MSKKRDLQILLELAQMDFTGERNQETRILIMDRLVDRFARNFVHKNDAASPRMSLEKLQHHLAPVITYLRSGEIVEDFDFQYRLLKSEGKLVSFLHWEDHLLLTLIQRLNNVAEGDLHTCPRCGNYFVKAGKQIKIYCTRHCTTEAH